MNFEICTENLSGAKLAAQFNANRIELCSAISLGGLTPSFGNIEQCVDFGNIDVHVLIRPRGGGFCYSNQELDLMQTDIVAASKLGAKGVVLGVLNEQNQVAEMNLKLLDLAKSNHLQVTFHRAFDLVSNMERSMERIIEMQFDRVLTSGLNDNVFLGLKNLSLLAKNYGDQIEIMAGGGVNKDNAKRIASLGIQNLHFTSHKPGAQPKPGFGVSFEPDETKIKSIVSLF
ncbi:MAG: copper homeostasis protein CutC [Lutimonas sp.]